MLFLDTMTMERRLVSLPKGTELLVVNSGIPRALAGTQYNQRRAECEAAAAMLGIPSYGWSAIRLLWSGCPRR